MNSFSERLKYLRERDNLTQDQLSQKTGLLRSRIANYESNRREPDFETLELLADFFNVDMEFLIGKSEIENRYPITEILSKYENLPTKEDEQINEEDRLLLDLFHTVPDEDKRMVLNMIRAALGNQE